MSLFRLLGQVGEESRTKTSVLTVPNQDLTHNISRVDLGLQNKSEYVQEGQGRGRGVSF